MRQIALLALLLAFAAAVYGQENILEKGLEGRSAADVISRRYVTPLRLVALPGELTAGVENPEALLRNFDGQLTTGTPDVCRLSTRDGRSASVLLDFGKELCGGIALSAAIRADQRALKVRIRLGESVSEAMSDVGGDAPMASATNEHSLRDFTLGVPWLGNVEAGNSGFRFVRIDLVEPDAELNLKAVRAILRYRDVPYLGSFRVPRNLPLRRRAAEPHLGDGGLYRPPQYAGVPLGRGETRPPGVARGHAPRGDDCTERVRRQ